MEVKQNSLPEVLGICASDIRGACYALFCADKTLYLCVDGKPPVPLALLPDIREETLEMRISEPWLCVAERYGLHCAVVNMQTGMVRRFQREDYCADSTSYSVGFLQRGGKTLFLHQTQWNRLDITDLASGELLTPREVYSREIKAGYKDDAGEWVPSKMERKNYLDYFHSRLHIAPDSDSFLDMGWLWQPFDAVRFYTVADFLENYDLAGTVQLEYPYESNWDRPCTYMGPGRFVFAVDDMRKNVDKTPREYAQLWCFRVESDAEGGYRCENDGQITCDVLHKLNDCEVDGTLYWDEATGLLVAMSARGTYTLTLEGEVRTHRPDMPGNECHYPAPPENKRPPGWEYSMAHRLFYRWDTDGGRVSTLALDEL